MQLSILIVSRAAAADVAPKTYWKSVLPNTPIPKAVSELLNIGTRVDKTSYIVGEQDGKHTTTDSHFNLDSEGALLILEKDMYQGHAMNIQFITETTSLSSSTFLPRKVANTIPFSSKNLPELYSRFSIKPGSIKSESLEKTINLCEKKGISNTYCATCLEDMVDFTTSKLGKKVTAISTEVIHPNKFQKYTIDSSRKVATNKFVVCHKLSYPYAVFYCHKTMNTRVYLVSLVGEDGTKAKGLAICHDNGAKLYPKDLVFKVLGVNPGTTPICHFLPEDHVVFVPY
uniref:BURP domain-containing protein 17-like n=1 Tax=Erigeron canadensis TaxID=72917 RepID=UPI001CB97AFC|nr:BURP domain-containing protein 17-like [Erigeron canadensis]